MLRFLPLYGPFMIDRGDSLKFLNLKINNGQLDENSSFSKQLAGRVKGSEIAQTSVLV